VVTFDATLPGTSAERWQPLMQHCAPLSLEGVTELLVLSAHPDDETLAAGGLIASAAARGIAVQVVIVTDGSASHPDSPTTTPGDLARMRAREAFEAIGLLAPDASLSLLGVADGQVRENEAAVTAAIDAAVADADSRALVLAPWRGDGHRDHRLVGELAAAAAQRHGRRLIEYPVWMWHWGTPESVDLSDARAFTLSAAERRTKGRAIAAHRSQVAALSPQPGDEAMLRPDFLEHFDAAHELFFAADATLDQQYFDALYERNPDPWRFATRWYEKRKRAITLASLPAERYASGLEIGCSIGLLTADLAERCDRLLAVDVAEAAVRQARQRAPLATVEQRDVTRDYPEGSFDLVVLSEVGYYLSTPALARLLTAIAASLSPTGVLVACHWRHPVADYPLSGDEVHDAISALGLHPVARHVEDDFVLEVLSRSSLSVAGAEGLL
jgi:LmbE family N-acetylglucosaminyl deacetylase/protein-L-isoaspartate O-methyltransferase